MINSEINGNLYREEFEKNGSVVIKNFLTEEYIEKLHMFFINDMPDHWWSNASYPGVDGNISYLRNLPEYQEHIHANLNYVNNIFYNGSNTSGIAGNISYHFYRTVGDHVAGCYCAECEFRTWLLSADMLNFLSNISGETYTSFSTTFASKYSEGCFLSPHTDHSNGDIGFVLQFTKDWKPQWGGLLHFMNDEGDQIEQVEVPTFNTLTLFRLPEQKGKWHYVSHVNPGVKSVRLAYSGWYVK